MNGRSFAEFHAARQSAGSLKAQAASWLDTLDHNDDPAIWISRFSRETILDRADALDQAGPDGLPLFGLPFAVKDNIDVAGLPTTAACPDFSYHPTKNAPVVESLLAAGAICIGKTNLDQFATGLVGTRSPYGIPRNACHADFIPGGSSSGSAVAVARGLVAFALGTDTAGSGRVPAAFNGIVGWKPTRGLLSTRGVVPACRSLDCVSVFVSRPEDLEKLFPLLGHFDPADPWSRKDPGLAVSPIRRVAIPLPAEMVFFGDSDYARCWQEALDRLRTQGMKVFETSMSAFFDAARLLYEGPWVAERYLATRTLLESSPESIHPVTRGILQGGSKPSAADAFSATYRLAELRRVADHVWEQADAILLPTTGTIFRKDEIEADPLRLNSQLGYYTNFFNLLDLCGLAVPAGTRKDGLPFGITWGAPAFRDRDLLVLNGCSGLATGRSLLAVCGAHMRGFPLEKQLTELGGFFVREDVTSANYHLFALDELRPGLVRASSGGSAISLEVWSLPTDHLGRILASIPSPLGLGKIELSTGELVTGFLCEAAACEGKQEISRRGGWRGWKNRAG
ncbi:MAG: allophanate hydrolase [Terrimicrobiaceae bacterium]